MSAQSATAMETTKGAVPAKPSFEDLFVSIYDSISRRAFELFDGNGHSFGNDLADWFRAETEILRPLPMELKEEDDGFTVRAEVPGFTAKELEISLEPRCLRIAGRHEIKEEEKKKGKVIRSELRADQILRVIDLPVDVDTSKASANLRDGVLTLELPKAAHAKAVKVELKPS